MPKMVTDNKIWALQISSEGDNNFYGDKDKISGNKKDFSGATKKNYRQPKNLQAATNIFGGSQINIWALV